MAVDSTPYADFMEYTPNQHEPMTSAEIVPHKMYTHRNILFTGTNFVNMGADYQQKIQRKKLTGFPIPLGQYPSSSMGWAHRRSILKFTPKSIV
jgi:hypothetical protein